MSDSSSPHGVVIFKDVMVPMRDGVRLAMDLHCPATGNGVAPGKRPTILIRTSIGKANAEWQPVVEFFPPRGYVVAIQDLRSRHNSEGNGEYYHARNPWEGEDGYDTIEWIAAQPWSNGRVGMMGSSHRAIVQTQAAVHRPPHLAAICPEQGPTRTYQGEGREGGALCMQIFPAVHVHALESQEIRDDPAAVARIVDGMLHLREWLQRTPWVPGKTPLSGASCMEKTLFDYYHRGEYDEWWASEGCDQARLFPQHADIPVLITGGWFDPFVADCTHHFETLARQNRSKTRLIIGPWSHGGMRSGRSWLGDVDFGVQSVQGYPKHSELRLRWFDRWLKDIRNGVEDDPPVELFVMGGGSGRRDARGHLDHGGAWRAERGWPIARTRARTLYLHPGGALSEAVPEPGAKPASFVYNPTDPVPTVGGSHFGFNGLTALADGALPEVPPFGYRLDVYGPFIRSVVPIGPMHQKEAPGLIGVEPPYRLLSERPDVLVFQTPPLERDTEVTGPVLVELSVSSTAVDTDFTAKLVDVYPPTADYPDGYHMLLADSIIRCRYRDSWTQPEMMRPGEVYRVTVRLPPTSNLFKAGHRIRIDISSSNFPRFDVNPNTGEPVGRHTRMVTAVNLVHLDRARPSRALLPVVPPE